MRMRKELRAALALAVAGCVVAGCAVAGCGAAAPERPQTPQAQRAPVVARGAALTEPAADPRPYGAADTAFGLDVLGAWCRADPQANLVLSPSSLASGLGMAYLGARGSTAQAMAATLHLPATTATGGQALEAGLQARSSALRRLDGPGVTLDASDQVWADPSLTTLRSYLNAVATGYDAGVARVPLLRDPGQAAQQINQAIAAATHGQIPQLLSPGSLQNIGWILTDALYLKAAWATPFQASQTSPAPFTTASGQHVSAQFMNGGPFAAASVDGWTAVWLPYRGGRLAMVALLPPANTDGCTMPAAEQLGALTAGLKAEGGAPTRDIALPKVSIQDKISMQGLLTQLGMGIAFTGAADFAGLSPQACCIGLVEQAATLRVAEQGTVASAATAVGVAPAAAQAAVPPPIRFDRPYLMVVTDAATGEPLIMARVTDPAAHLRRARQRHETRRSCRPNVVNARVHVARR
jgi:serine protease inhibitor